MKVIGAKKRTIYIGYDRKTAYIVYDCSSDNTEDIDKPKKPTKNSKVIKKVGDL